MVDEHHALAHVGYRTNYALRAQFAARFSANDASPSDASAVWRLAACIRTRRA